MTLSIEDPKFFIREDRASGGIKFSVIQRAVKGTGGWLLMGLVMLSSYILLRIQYTVTFNVNGWANQYFKKKINDQAQLNFILWLNLVLEIIYFFNSFVVYWSITWMARTIHSRMAFKLLHAKIVEFLQRTSVGIIMNRFSNDINNIDNNYISILNITFITLSGVIVSLTSIFTTLNSFLPVIPTVAFLVIGYIQRQRYMKANREMVRLANISKSPVIGLATSSIYGSPVIRTMGIEDYLLTRIDERINNNTKNNLMNLGLNKWFDFQMAILKNTLILLPLNLLLLYNVYTIKNSGDKKEGAQIATYLNYITRFSGLYSLTLSLISNIETNLISVERCNRYENLDSEIGYQNIEQEAKMFEVLDKGKARLAKTYLNQYKRPRVFKSGAIRFRNVSAKYPTGRTNVISDVDIFVESGQKVGIVGRTGAGKSSFIKLIWRALEPIQGMIEVDGIDIRTLDVKKYREQLNVILQKPNLFEGTLLSNISATPLTTSQISEIKHELADLGFPTAKLLQKDLSFEVKVGGSNLSQSEKQIVCLMQTLQRDSPIVVLDEATAYVDTTMERKFQEKIMSRFRDSTMFIIAHRLTNVVECDRILVFDKGRIIEDGNPKELLQNPNGAFYEIWKKQ